MTSQEYETKILEQLFGPKTTIKNLKLGDLIYLKDSLDKRIKDHAVGCDVIDFMEPNLVKTFLKKGYSWKDEIAESEIIKQMSPEEALYLDCLIRLNEIHVNMSYIGLNPLGKV